MQHTDHRLTEFAKELRKQPTAAEKALWRRLRFSEVLRFRRQQPIGPYIVDMFCAAVRVVIELDGGSHNERLQADIERQTYLEAQGLRVIRVLNDDVLRDPVRIADGLEAACLAIANARGGRLRRGGAAKREPPPPPNPLPRGEGETESPP